MTLLLPTPYQEAERDPAAQQRHHLLLLSCEDVRPGSRCSLCPRYHSLLPPARRGHRNDHHTRDDHGNHARPRTHGGDWGRRNALNDSHYSDDDDDDGDDAKDVGRMCDDRDYDCDLQPQAREHHGRDSHAPGRENPCPFPCPCRRPFSCLSGL